MIASTVPPKQHSTAQLTTSRAALANHRPTIRTEILLPARTLLLQLRLPLPRRHGIRRKILERKHTMSFPRATGCAGRGLCRLPDG
jgi:hypothetical protein